jgi:hypothetical protein
MMDFAGFIVNLIFAFAFAAIFEGAVWMFWDWHHCQFAEWRKKHKAVAELFKTCDAESITLLYIAMTAAIALMAVWVIPLAKFWKYLNKDTWFT